MKASFLIGDMPLYEPICYNLYSISYWACVTARGRLTCTEGQIELIHFICLDEWPWDGGYSRFFSWDSSTLLLSKTGRPVISINVATPENNVKYVATTYIDIRQNYLKLFAFTFIGRGIAWCGTLCGMACCGMLCGMPRGMPLYAMWDGIVRYAMWNGEVCYVAWHGVVCYVAWHGMICYVAWYMECFGMVYDVVYYMIWYGIWCMHICMRVLCVNTAETTGGNYWQPKPRFSKMYW